MTGGDVYGLGALQYLRRGWDAPLPLPPRAKVPPPAGFTGHNLTRPDERQVRAWVVELADSNIAIRVPDGVIAIDVDAYEPKRGAQTVAAWEGAYGPLPSTWWSTRRADGVSGKRFYRVPSGRRWISELKATTPSGLIKDVEIVQPHHRFAVVWPSVDADGRIERWLDPTGAVSDIIPRPEDLAELPEAWVRALSRATTRAEPPRYIGGADVVAARVWIDSLLAGPPCKEMTATLLELVGRLAGEARHAVMRAGCLRLLRLGQQGHTGGTTCLDQLREAFYAAVHDEPGRDPAHEWSRAFEGAVACVSADGSPSPDAMCRCVAAEFRSHLGNTNGFTRGRSGVNERLVLRCLLATAEAVGSVRVRMSQRQIAEVVGLHQSGVSCLLAKLEKHGWLVRVRGPGVGEGSTYRLLLRRTRTSDGAPTEGESSAQAATPHLKHFVFGGKGLGAGVAESWSVLPMLGMRLQHGKLFGLPLLRATDGQRPRYTLRFRAGAGLTKAQQSRLSGKSPSTVDRHLKILAAQHLALRDWRGTWWALNFDPDALADELGLMDPRPDQHQKHRRDRINYYGAKAESEAKADGRFLIVVADGVQAIVDPRSGLILERADTVATADALARWFPDPPCPETS